MHELVRGGVQQPLFFILAQVELAVEFLQFGLDSDDVRVTLSADLLAALLHFGGEFIAHQDISEFKY